MVIASRPIQDNKLIAEQALRRIIRLADIRRIDALASVDYGGVGQAEEIKRLAEIALHGLLET